MKDDEILSKTNDVLHENEILSKDNRLDCEKNAQQLEIWCICKNNKRVGKMIMCSNETQCKSYKARLEINNAIGGNWFHFSCMRVKIEPKGDWYCQMCQPKSELKN